MMMSSVFEEEIHQFIQVILTFNSKGLGEKQNDYCNTTEVNRSSAPEDKRLVLLPSTCPAPAMTPK